MSPLRICATPGCAALFEPEPNRYHCPKHITFSLDGHADLEGDHEEEARHALRQMLADAEAIMRRLAESESKGRGWQRYTAEQVVQHVPAVLNAALSGELWTAVRHALWTAQMAAECRSAAHNADVRP